MVMPRPVELLSGDTNRPSDCRAPMVTIRIAAAAKVTIQTPRVPGVAFVVVVIVGHYMTDAPASLGRADDDVLQQGAYFVARRTQAGIRRG